MQRLFIPLVVALAVLGCDSDAARNSSAPADRAATLVPLIETAPSGADEGNDVAIWIHPQDTGLSMLVASAGAAGLETYGLDGALIARYGDVELDHVKLAYGFPLQDTPRTLVVGYDRSRGGLVTFAIDPQSRRVSPLFQRALPTHTEIVGLCLYRSPVNAAYYAFASGDDGVVQQWQFFTHGDRVDGRLVRTIPVGVGAGYCVADDAAREVYIAEESVGVWKFRAEPESDATRSPFALVQPLGTIEEEVKGLALYKVDGDHGYLIVSDVDAARFNVHSLADAALLGSFKLGGGTIDEVDDAEGIAVVNYALSGSVPGGALAVVDTADDRGSNIKLVAWQTIAAALKLDSAGATMDPRQAPPPAARVVSASVETTPAASHGDAADDPAIWIHPTDPSRSLIIGTDKKRGLEVYNLAGERVQELPDGRMNNVDLRYGFQLGGREVAVAAATNRTDKTLALYSIDAHGRLTDVADGKIPTGFDDPYGLCMYRSAKSGDYYVFANDGAEGAFRQWRLSARGGKIGAELVREFVVGTQAEGCAADDATGRLYIAEEDVGLWRYSAEPDADATRHRIDDVKSGNLVDDVEGVAIYYGDDGAGYVIVSSQGAENYAVYRREGDNEFVGLFHIVADIDTGIDGASETDGLDVTSAPLGAAFPHGLLVVQDGRNITPPERQNFKLVPWQRIATALGLPSPDRNRQ